MYIHALFLLKLMVQTTNSQVAHVQPCDSRGGVKAVFHKTPGVGVGLSSQRFFAELRRDLVKPAIDFLSRDSLSLSHRHQSFLTYVVLIE